MIWVLISIVCFCVSLWVHKHTYIVEKNRIAKLRVFHVIMYLIISSIPILNILVFVLGLGVYAVAIDYGDIKFEIGSNTGINKFLNKEL